MPFWLDYSGHTVDEFDTEAEAEAGKRRLIDNIFAGRLPDFLTAEDFEDRAEAEADFTITPYQED